MQGTSVKTADVLAGNSIRVWAAIARRFVQVDKSFFQSSANLRFKVPPTCVEVWPPCSLRPIATT